MSCLSASLTRVGGLAAGMTGTARLGASLERSGRMLAGGFARVGNFSGRFVRRGGAWMGMSAVCDANIAGAYLRIDPEILWLVDWGTNDVYSNTHWNVD